MGDCPPEFFPWRELVFVVAIAVVVVGALALVTRLLANRAATIRIGGALAAASLLGGAVAMALYNAFTVSCLG